MHNEKVQVLASQGLDKLPIQFIRQAHEQPKKTQALEGVQIPLISLSQPHDVIVQTISRVAKEWGFFVIKDHGISPSLIKRVPEVGCEFFALSQEEKERYANDPLKGNFEGYGTKLFKNPQDKVEWVDYYFHLISPHHKVNYDIWPKDPPCYRQVIEEYSHEISRKIEKILALLSEGLGVEINALKTHLGDDEIELEMKINMYPPCPEPDLTLGVEPHTDMCALTILVPNHVPGLQIWKDGNWIAIDYIQDALYIHIGDQIEVLSNGKYKSALHRSVVHTEKTRMSWAVFCVPPSDTIIGPLPQLVNYQNPAKYSTHTYGDFRYHKINKLPQ